MSVMTVSSSREQRAREISSALASVRLEGLEPSDEAKAIYDRYVDGALTPEEMGRAIDDLLKREYGPLHLTRHKRP